MRMIRCLMREPNFEDNLNPTLCFLTSWQDFLTFNIGYLIYLVLGWNFLLNSNPNGQLFPLETPMLRLWFTYFELAPLRPPPGDAYFAGHSHLSALQTCFNLTLNREGQTAPEEQDTINNTLPPIDMEPNRGSEGPSSRRMVQTRTRRTSNGSM